MDREVVLITGGNSGIGLSCARALARAGRHVVLASRNREASRAAVERILRESGTGSASELGVDLASLASVRALVKEIEDLDLPLRALVCNAGLQVNAGPQLSEDGFELTFAANHLGHFLLANLLLPRLACFAPARIVVVSSGVHDPANATGMPKPEIADFAELAAGGRAGAPFDGRLAYANSKLCNVWFAYELERRIAAVSLGGPGRRLTVNAWEPGLVPGSGLARDYPALLRLIWNWVLPGVGRVLHPLVPGISTLARSGEALARMVLDPELALVTGKYFPSTARWREAPSSQDSYDVERARGLWSASARMAGLRAGESPLGQD